VQQEQVAGGQPPGETAHYLSSVTPHRIEAAPSPADVAQAGTGKHRIEQRISKSHRCSKKLWCASRDTLDDLLRPGDLPVHAIKTAQGEDFGVSPAVVFDTMTARMYLTDDFGMGRCFPADAEEAGLGAMPIQEIQNSRSDGRVRAVIKGEGNLALESRILG